jgi:hypothetical protein
LANLAWGLRQALWFAVAFSLLVFAGALCSGRDDVAGSLGTPLAAAGRYFAMAVAAGVALGLGRPWLQTWGGALSVGTLGGAAAFAALLWDGPGASGSAEMLRTALGAGALAGMLLAAYIHVRSRNRR